MHIDQRPSGPEFLSNVAEQNLAQGLLQNAAEFAMRAAEWQRDRATIDELTSANARLRDHVQRIRTAAQQADA